MNMFKKKPKPETDELLKEGIVALSYQDLERSKTMYRSTIGALSVVSLILAVMAFSNKTEVVVMPPDYWEPVITKGKFANEAYAAGHAMNIANLMGNVNEKNIDFVTDNVLRMLSPHLRAQLVQAFNAEVQILKSRRARQSFYIEDVMFEGRNNLVWVWGTKRTSTMGNQEVSERYTYEFRIEPSNGMPRITHFNAYSGIPKPRDPNLSIAPEPYLTRDLALVKAMSTVSDKPAEIVYPDKTSVTEQPPAAPQETTDSAAVPNQTPEQNQ